MASDRETLREVWDGRIPVCFTLSVEEIDSETPEPVFVSNCKMISVKPFQYVP